MYIQNTPFKFFRMKHDKNLSDIKTFLDVTQRGIN